MVCGGTRGVERRLDLAVLGPLDPAMEQPRPPPRANSSNEQVRHNRARSVRSLNSPPSARKPSDGQESWPFGPAVAVIVTGSGPVNRYNARAGGHGRIPTRQMARAVPGWQDSR